MSRRSQKFFHSLVLVLTTLLFGISSTYAAKGGSKAGGGGGGGGGGGSTPAVSIVLPVDGSVVTTPSVQVSGTVEANKLLGVIVNGVEAFVAGGEFNATVALTEGSNKIIALANYKGGKDTSTSIDISVDNETPNVVSAISQSNTEVLLQFSEPVVGADDIGNISIVSQQHGSDLPAWDAMYYGADQSAVQLRTFSQSSATYVLKVSNIRDLAGNPIAAPTILIDPSKTTFVGIDPGGSTLVDSDADGLPDHTELFGWDISIELLDGTSISRHVTSDPGNPNTSDPNQAADNVAAKDTDKDGLADPVEKQAGADPRRSDTDGDLLPDNDEWNIVLSNPADQDTDDEGLDDGSEISYFRSSPIIADTDGDQYTDDVEILENNRNPRIADLPRAAINVGEVELRIDERFTYEDTQSNTVTVESSSNSTLSQSRNDTFATSNTDVTEHVASVGLETGSESGEGGRGAKAAGGLFLTISGGYQYTSSNSFTTDQSSAVESQRVYEQSLSKTQEFNTTSAVTREVFGASIDALLTIQNTGDVPFSIRDLEVTVLQRSRESTDRFVPIATLIPNSTLITGEPAVFNLGPFADEIGPIVFSSRDVFPGLVEELMKSPSGLIFKVANFNMTDEQDRVFTYSNQNARDRTAGIIVDTGDGEAEQYLVATALQQDVNQIVSPKYVGGFDEQALPLGIPLDFAMQDILGLQKNSSIEDGIVAGPNKQTETLAAGDDIQLIPPGTTGVSVGSIAVSAGPDGILQSIPGGDDEKLVTTGYETSLTCPADAPDPDKVGEVCAEDSDCGTGGSCSGPEILTRFGSLRNGDFNRVWVVLTNGEIPAGASWGHVVMKPGKDLFLAFVQDLDEDGLFAREEYMSGSTDSRADIYKNADFGENFDEATASVSSDDIPDSKDTDRDGLGDFAEIRVGWKVTNDGGSLRQVFSSPRLRDSDGDGLLDPVEMDLRRYCAANDPRDDALCAFQDNPVAIGDAIAIVAGPNGEADTTAASGDEQLIAVGTPNLTYGSPIVGVGSTDGIQTTLAGDDEYIALSSIPPASNPVLGDTDGDAIGDQTELEGFKVGLSIKDGGNGTAETWVNADDIQKVAVGHPVKPGGVVILPGDNGTIDSTKGGDDQLQQGLSVVTDPLVRDTDSDLVADGRELAQGGNPTNPADGQDFKDSDLDGLTDAEERDNGWQIVVQHATLGSQTRTVKSNPSLPDSDYDGLPDYVERDIRTDPNRPDTDGDTLSDYDEFANFDKYFGLDQQFPRFSIDGSNSMQYGTKPTHWDSDLDQLSDNFELLEGYRVLLAGEQSFRQVYTNPLASDTDFDGRTDKEEYDRNPKTDASDPDTDDDGRTDGQEQTASTDPLVPDVRITTIYNFIDVKKGDGDGDNGDAEWAWWFYVGTNGSFPGQAVSYASKQSGYKTEGTCQYVQKPDLTDIFLSNASRSFPLHPGEGFSLFVELYDYDDCDGGTYIVECPMSDEKFYSYEEFSGGVGGFTGASFDLNDTKCSAEVFYQVIVD